MTMPPFKVKWYRSCFHVSLLHFDASGCLLNFKGSMADRLLRYDVSRWVDERFTVKGGFWVISSELWQWISRYEQGWRLYNHLSCMQIWQSLFFATFISCIRPFCFRANNDCRIPRQQLLLEPHSMNESALSIASSQLNCLLFYFISRSDAIYFKVN